MIYLGRWLLRSNTSLYGDGGKCNRPLRLGTVKVGQLRERELPYFTSNIFLVTVLVPDSSRAK